MNKKIVGLTLMALMGFALGLSAEEKKAENPMKKIYDMKCASCHGKDGKGNANLAKAMKLDPALYDMLKKETLEKKDEDLIAITAKGQGKMPAYEKQLKAEEISGLVAYIRSLAPAPVKSEEKPVEVK